MEDDILGGWIRQLHGDPITRSLSYDCASSKSIGGGDDGEGDRRRRGQEDSFLSTDEAEAAP